MSMNPSTSELIQYFELSCSKNFIFLEEIHGFKRSFGLDDFPNTIKKLKKPNYEENSGFFLAVTRYQKNNIGLEISYGR